MALAGLLRTQHFRLLQKNNTFPAGRNQLVVACFRTVFAATHLRQRRFCFAIIVNLRCLIFSVINYGVTLQPVNQIFRQYYLNTLQMVRS